MMKQKSFDEEMKQLFGGKVYRLCLSSAVTCPNRDGTISTGGCIFCSEGGSGEFASDASLPIEQQLSAAKEKVASKLSRNFAGYMAYFQSFSSTYAPFEQLKEMFEAAIADPEVLALSIATRPDCLPEKVLDLIGELNQKKPVWVELGLQTMHEDTAKLINRGYSLPVFEKAVLALRERGVRVVVHTIIGLPGETRDRILETFRYLRDFSAGRTAVPRGMKPSAAGSVPGLTDPGFPDQSALLPLIDAVKLQQLSILKGTRLAAGIYESDKNGQEPAALPVYSLEEYAALLKEILDILPEQMYIHRLTSDPPRLLLLSPLWSRDKKKVLNYLKHAL